MLTVYRINDEDFVRLTAVRAWIKDRLSSGAARESESVSLMLVGLLSELEVLLQESKPRATKP